MGLEIRTTGSHGRYDHQVRNIGTNTGDSPIRSEAVESLKLANEKVYGDMPQGSKNLVSRTEFKVPETFSSVLKRAFKMSFPYSVIASILLTAGFCAVKYHDASMIVDTNRDGVVSESEWREAYKVIGKEYPPRTAVGGLEMNPIFALNENVRIVDAYRDGRFSRDDW